MNQGIAPGTGPSPVFANSNNYVAGPGNVNNFIQQNGSNFVQQDGVSVFLEN